MYLLPDHEEDLEVRDILFLAWCKRVRKHRRTSKVCGHWDSRCHWHTFAGRFAFGRWFHPAPYPFDEVGIHQVWQSSLELTSDFEWNPHHLQDNIKNVYSHPPLRVMTRYGISWASGGQRSVPNRENCQGIHLRFKKGTFLPKSATFSRQIGV